MIHKIYPGILLVLTVVTTAPSGWGGSSKCFTDAHDERVAVPALGNVRSEIDTVFLAEFESKSGSAGRQKVAIAELIGGGCNRTYASEGH
jgi:hypothetical protein